MAIESYAFVIPAYNPDENLLALVERIVKNTNFPIFIIDDGSKEDTQYIFQAIEEEYSLNKQVILIKHAINLGKGAALKTIFNYILTTYPQIKGIVTLDSDGQHKVEDALKVLKILEKNSNNQDILVLGYRTFSKDIPLKSYIGNNISKFIYKLILGRDFKDTQTGLRGLSSNFMKKCLSIKSNRFEFETEQLALATKEHIKIIETPIETIYIEGNKSTSFRPLVDSFKIYFVLFRYALSSVTTALVDFIIFTISLSFGFNVFWSNMIARTVSIGVQYTLLDKYVFYSNTKFLNFFLFAAYVYIMGIISASSQIAAIEFLNFPVLAAKVIIEGILFFVNFAFLRLFIFNNKGS